MVVRLSAMGDVAMTVPVLNALLGQYPDLRLTVLTRGFFKPMFSQLTNVTVFEADVKGRHKGVFGLYTLYTELSKLQIDGVADLHNVLRSNILKAYFKLGGTPFFQIDKGRDEKKALTAPKNKVLQPLKTTHQRYADVFGALGFPVDLTTASPLARQKCPEKVYGLVGREARPWIGIAPFAAFRGKMYPLGHMQRVIEELNALDKYKILLFGGGDDERKKLAQIAQSNKNAFNMVGELSFPEELALISNLDLMLSMDSGNGHLAAMYGVPVITIWGVTHPYAGFYPFGQDPDNALLADRDRFPLIPTSVYGNKMPDGYEKAMETITPDDVLAKIDRVLVTT